MNKQILIVGGGAAGVAAAVRLLENGFRKVTILEAEPRIGGRIKTVPYGNGFLDLGAQWCHGEKNNVVFELAKDLDVLARPLATMPLEFIQSDGTALSDVTNAKLANLMSVLDVEENEINGSHGELLLSKYEAALTQPEYQDIAMSAIKTQFLDTLQRWHRLANASDSWFDLSSRGCSQREACDGENLLDWKGKGYGTIFGVLLKKFTHPFEPKIYLKKTVRQICWSKDNYPTIVECVDGTKFIADHVICTVSVGVLRAHLTTMFTPALPAFKSNAIESIRLGTVNKIYIEFATPFWAPNWSGFSALWRDTELSEIRADPDENWMECVYQFSTVRYHPNVLCGWPTGPLARDIEKLPDEDVMRVVVKWLRRFLKNRIVSEPVRILRSRWSSEPNFLGSYSYESVRSDELNSSRADLGAPVLNAAGDPVLQFAGEATELHHFASVHGAVETGWREAERLIKLYK